MVRFDVNYTYLEAVIKGDSQQYDAKYVVYFTQSFPLLNLEKNVSVLNFI